MIIDQQRAHIRILYDKYIDQISRRQGISQGMLFQTLCSFRFPKLLFCRKLWKTCLS